MKIKLFFPLLFISICSIGSLSAQNPQVNHLTGSLSLSENLYNIELEGKVFPISANYNTRGLKVGEGGGRIGHGWNLSITGFINRIVNKIPDDYQDLVFTGWLYQNNFSELNSLYQSLSGESCINTYDNQQNADLYNDLSDHMKSDVPDEFYVNFPGISGTILFNSNGTPYFQENNGSIIQVNYINDESDQFNEQIESFIITDRDGFKYYFSIRALTSQVSEDENEVGYVGNGDIDDYEQDEVASYANSWYLEFIESPAGEKAVFNYDHGNISLPIKSAYAKTHFVKKGQDYEMRQTGYKRQWSFKEYLRSIDVYDDASNNVTKKIIFEGSPKSSDNLHSGFKGFVNEIDPINRTSTLNRSNERLSHIKIYELKEKGLSLILKYKFIFHKERFGSLFFLKSIASIKGTKYLNTSEYDYALIKNTSLNPKNHQRDHWGYFNNENYEEGIDPPLYPSINIYTKVIDASGDIDDLSNINFKIGYETIQENSYEFTKNITGWGEFNKDVVTFGSLNGIKRPSGSYVKIEYEPNDYYDSELEESIYGGGIRVKSISHLNSKNDAELEFDSLDYLPQKNTYNYLGKNGFSSGKPVNKPHYSFPLQYYFDPNAPTQKKLYSDLINEQSGAGDPSEAISYLIAIANYDLDGNSQNYTIYDRVVTTESGKGSIEYNYQNNGVLGSTSDFYHEEALEMYQFLDDDTDTCFPLGLYATGLTYRFPFSPLYNQNISNGLLYEKKVFDEEGNILNKSKYNYLHSENSNQNKITAFEIKEISSVATPLIGFGSYDVFLNIRRRIESIVNKSYDQVDTTNSFTTQKRFNYDSTLKYLKSQEVIQAEKTEKVYYTYSSDYLTNNSYDTSSFAYALEQLQSRGIDTEIIERKTVQTIGNETYTVNGTINTYQYNDGYIKPKKQFSFNEILDRPFTDSSIDQNGNLLRDDAYQSKNTYTEFLNNQFLTSISQQGDIRSQHIDKFSNQTIVTIDGATASQILFTDFESNTPFSFNYADNLESELNNRFLKLEQGDIVESPDYNIKDETNFLLSLTYKSNNSITIDVEIKDISNNTNIFSQSIALNAVQDWDYQKIPIELGENSGDIRLVITSNNILSIDEIMFKPIIAYTNYIKYNSQGLPIEKTANNGRKTYLEYDTFERVLLKKDHEKNIINIQQYKSKVNDVLNADFTATPKQEGSSTYKFITKNQDPDLNYYWKFDSDDEYLGGTIETYTFDTITSNDHTVRLKVSHPEYGEKTKSISLDINP